MKMDIGMRAFGLAAATVQTVAAVGGFIGSFVVLANAPGWFAILAVPLLALGLGFTGMAFDIWRDVITGDF